MKMLFVISFFASFLVYTSETNAQMGCHYFCGRESADASMDYARSLGKTKWDQLTAAEKTEGLRIGEAKWNECKAATIHMTEAQCNGETSPGTVPTPVANPNTCTARYEELLNKCQAAGTSASSSCNSSQNSALNQASSSASSSRESSGITDSCGNVVTVATAAKNAWTSFRDQCSAAASSCQDACNELVTWANANPTCFPLTTGGRDIDKNTLAANIYSPAMDKCLDAQGEADKATATVASYGGTADSANNCKTSTAGGESSSTGNLLGQLAGAASSLLAPKAETATPAAVATFCTANPSYPGCGASAEANCSNPAYAATNKVCQCAVNPSACRTNEAAANSTSLASSVDPSSRLPTAEGANLDPGGMPNIPMMPAGGPSGSSDATSVDGRQGGGAPVGDSTVGMGGGPAGRPNVNPNHDDPVGGSLGSYGGGGSGSAARGLTYRGAAAVGGRPGGGGSKDALSGTPDLRQFLPGGSYNPHPNAIGGRVGIDGITGPNSNIWQKVQNRYQVLKDTLHP